MKSAPISPGISNRIGSKYLLPFESAINASAHLCSRKLFSCFVSRLFSDYVKCVLLNREDFSSLERKNHQNACHKIGNKTVFLPLESQDKTHEKEDFLALKFILMQQFVCVEIKNLCRSVRAVIQAIL